MGSKSSKAFKEKDSTPYFDSRSPTLVGTRPTSPVFPYFGRDKPLPPIPPKKPTPTKKRYGAGHRPSRSSSAYMSGTNSSTNPVFFSAATVDSGPSYSGGCDTSGGGGCDSGSGGGGDSGGCDSGGGSSSSSD